jgi:Tfp pilus assembly protein PilN
MTVNNINLVMQSNAAHFSFVVQLLNVGGYLMFWHFNNQDIAIMLLTSHNSDARLLNSNE